MAAKVISPFTDLETDRVFLPGDSFSGSAARVSELSGKGFVLVEKTAPKPRDKKQTER